jgi:hypothetical protein
MDIDEQKRINEQMMTKLVALINDKFDDLSTKLQEVINSNNQSSHDHHQQVVEIAKFEGKVELLSFILDICRRRNNSVKHEQHQLMNLEESLCNKEHVENSNVGSGGADITTVVISQRNQLLQMIQKFQKKSLNNTNTLMTLYKKYAKYAAKQDKAFEFINTRLIDSELLNEIRGRGLVKLKDSFAEKLSQFMKSDFKNVCNNNSNKSIEEGSLDEALVFTSPNVRTPTLRKQGHTTQ